MRKFRTWSMKAFEWMMAGYAVVLLALSMSPIYGQTTRENGQSIVELDRRVNKIETTIDGLAIDRRLAVIENSMSDLRSDSLTGKLGSGGVAALILERVWQNRKNRESRIITEKS